MIPYAVVDEARNILNTHGVVFENSSYEISKYLGDSAARTELFKILETDDEEYDEENDEGILGIGSISIKSLYTYEYFISKYSKLDEIYSKLNYLDSIKEAASICYGVDKEDIFFGFL